MTFSRIIHLQQRICQSFHSLGDVSLSRSPNSDANRVLAGRELTHTHEQIYTRAHSDKLTHGKRIARLKEAKTSDHRFIRFLSFTFIFHRKITRYAENRAFSLLIIFLLGHNWQLRPYTTVNSRQIECPDADLFRLKPILQTTD